MREHRVFAALHLLAFVAAVTVGTSACGDDEPEPKDASVGDHDGGRGGRGGGGGSGGSRAEPNIVPLADETAGKACEGDGDCAPGTCLSMLPGPFGSGSLPAPDGYCSGECADNADCGEGGVCSGAFGGLAGGIGAVRGRCLATCRESADCRSGYRCVNALGLPLSPDGGTSLGTSTCQPLPETDQLADGVVGSMCAADGDCGTGRCLRTSGTTSYPGGYCTGRCLDDDECGATGACTPSLTGGGAGTCYLRCNDDADCTRTGYRCRETSAGKECLPGAPPLPDDVVGDACANDAECGGAAMSCGSRLGRFAAPGGYCSQRCVGSIDCGEGGVCVGGRGGATASGTCYRACTDGSECREGYSCSPAGRTGTAATQNICAVTDDAGDAGTN